MNPNRMIAIVRMVAGVLFAICGFVWLLIALGWYQSFPVPYVWLVWALTAPIWWVGAAIWMIDPIKARARLRRLKKNGVRVQTKYVATNINFKLQYNHQFAYVIQSVGKSPKDGQTFMFQSEDLWFNPGPFLSAGQSIDVIVDPGDPMVHLMDLSFLPDQAKRVMAGR